MKGYAMLGINKTGWIEKEKPRCGNGDAIVRPIAVAPCTSDVHTVWEGALGDKHDLILGHEAVGEIVEIGSQVKDFKPGDKVIISAITPYWAAVESQAGYSVHSGGMLGGWQFSNTKDGVFGEFFHVNDADGNLALLPEELDPETATMLSDMVSTGLHGSELANVTFGDTVCVIGIGPVGLMGVAGAALSGASSIYAVGSRPNCAQVAREYGATDIINYKNGDILIQVMDKTKGRGVDKVIIAGGDVDTFIDAVKMVKPGGVIANINYLGTGDFIKIPRVEWGFGMAHKTIKGGLMPGGRRRMEKLASLLVTGRIDVSKLLTHRFEGFDKIEPALMLMKDKPKDLIKPVVTIKW
jgi:threonine dehydrogenase-like Zn-dependent dehydrogenase